jgi:hypothetical protein
VVAFGVAVLVVVPGAMFLLLGFAVRELDRRTTTPDQRRLAHSGPALVTIGPMVRLELERVEALELLGMTLAHLKEAETRMLMAIRDKLAASLQEES